jgi:uncharacterized protein YkwD
MGKVKWFIILIIIIAAFAVGVYYSTEIKNQIKNIQNIDVGQLVNQATKQINFSNPLNIGGSANSVVLLQSKIIEETNLQRQQNGGLPALKENLKLNEAAAAKTNDMFLNQYFEHVSPSGVGPGDLAQRYGYDYIIEGENLILGNFASEKEVVQNWMDSPGHRANILNNRYTEIGVAVVKGKYKGETVWIGVQEFGLPLSTCSAPNTALKNQIDSEKAQLDELALQLDAKKNQIESTNKHSPIYSQMIDNYNQTVAEYNALAEKVKQDVATYNNQVNTFNNCVAGN